MTSTSKSFNHTRANFLYFLHSYLPAPSLRTESDFSKNCILPVEQIILAADKNIGFVCLDVVDMLCQYELINVQQHFCKVTFDEPTYIDFILKFITSASFSIPHKLSLLASSSRYEV